MGYDSNVGVLDEQGNVLLALGGERLNRIKQYPGFPKLALEHALAQYGDRIEAVYTVRLPRLKRILRELAFKWNARRKGLHAQSFASLLRRYGNRVRRRTLEAEGGALLGRLAGKPMIQVEHHLAHAGSAFYHSGFERALIMTLDGEGDGYSGGFYRGGPGGIERLEAFYYNEVTLGRDYEKVTAMLGFHPLRHPGKITGLAAYGEPSDACMEALADYLASTWREAPDRAYFTQHAYQVISDEGRKELVRLRRERFGRFSDEEIAASIQEITERRIVELIARVRRPEDRCIALAGGVFANVKVNKRVKEMGFERIFIQPAMSDQGLAVGAILYVLGQEGRIRPRPVESVYLGPEYDNDAIREELERAGLRFHAPEDPVSELAGLIVEGKVCAVFQGRMEFGPRALGNRSILYHTTDPSVNDWLNRQLVRTEFMPFAPVTLEEFAPRCYENLAGAEHTARFMTITFDCSEEMKRQSPAVVHVDGTARPQIVSERDNPRYFHILKEYWKATGIPSLVNTSFNMHEEPIVCSPHDAVRAFIKSRLDAMLIGEYIVRNER